LGCGVNYFNEIQIHQYYISFQNRLLLQNITHTGQGIIKNRDFFKNPVFQNYLEIYNADICSTRA
jgi:hypothetical protein